MPNIKLSKKQIIIIGGAVVLVIVIFVVLFLGMRPKVNTGPAAKLTIWGTEDKALFTPILANYSGAQLTYVQLDPANYNTKLLAALVTGTGPDVFEISNRELPKWRSVVIPLPTTTASFTPLQVGQYFPDVVTQDFIWNGQIYGLPLSIDTLAMVYNKDLFNTAGIAVPPKTWNDLDADIAKLRVVNAQGQIAQAAAAIGGSTASIPNVSDLVALLMLQNGTQMTNANFTSAQFASGGSGVGAFNFYLQFANAASPYYTWSDSLGDAFDSFVAGKTAIIFAYESDLATIKAKAPFLNIGIAPMPQPAGATVTINYPKYEGFVAAKAGQATAAWNFILYLTVSSGDGKMYQGATGKPPALRADIQADANDPNLSVFAAQALTAKSWYEADDAQVDIIMNEAVLNVMSGAADSAKALNEAQTAVTTLMSQ